MENLSLLEAVKKLTASESITISVDEDTINKLQYLQLKRASYESLYKSYLNGTTEKANEFNLQKFLDAYAQLNYEHETLYQDTVLNLVGTEVYIFMTRQCRNIRFMIDQLTKQLVIRKIMLGKPNNGGQNEHMCNDKA